MLALRTARICLVALLSISLSGLPAYGLVSIDDGKNQLFVNSTLTIGYDSNMFARAGGGGDLSYSLDLSTEFIRRAGWIGVNGSAGVNATYYGTYQEENFQNPRFRLEFTKQSGRTTGSVTLGAARQSRADPAVNVRTESWNYDAGLAFKYPVIERYSLSGNATYTRRDYDDNAFFVDLSSVSAGLDLFYSLSTDRDLVAGYRFRREISSLQTRNIDHAFTAGVSGKIIPRLNGSIRGGFQVRLPQDGSGESFESWTGGVGATYNLNKRAIFSLQVAKDFSTTSTNITVDTTSATLNSQYTVNSRTSVGASAGFGDSRFLGVLGNGREDQYWTWSVSLNRTLGRYMRASLTFLQFENYSTESFSEFERQSVTLSLSARL